MKEVTKTQELAYELKISDVMTRDVITISPDNLMADLRPIMRDKRISGLPVVNQDRLVGLVSIEDFIKCLWNGEMNKPIKEKMTKDVVTIYEDEPLVHAIEKFERYGFGRFPVLERGTGRLVGILTKSDIIRGLLKKLEIVCQEEELRRYRASHLFKDLVSDKTILCLEYYVKGNDFKHAGEASSSLKKSLSRLGIHPKILRRVAIASYEAEMNLVIFTHGGKIEVCVEKERIMIHVGDDGPGIPDIEKALEPGFSTAPEWVRELGFGAGMGLPNIKKCADEFRIESKVGEGTHLYILFYTKERKDET